MLLNKFDTPLDHCDLKFDDGRQGVFEGYASVFGRVDSFGDTVVKGAFEQTLKDRTRMPLMLYGHSVGRVIGKWLELKEDDTGLRATGELTPGHTDAENVKASLLHRAITGLSIGFRANPNGIEETEAGGRILKSLDLVEISVVSMPAEDEARVDMVKNEIETIKTIRDAELFLREAGTFPRSMAKALLSQLRQVFQRDADDDATQQIKALQAAAGKGELLQIINTHTRNFNHE